MHKLSIHAHKVYTCTNCEVELDKFHLDILHMHYTLAVDTTIHNTICLVVSQLTTDKMNCDNRRDQIQKLHLN